MSLTSCRAAPPRNLFKNACELYVHGDKAQAQKPMFFASRSAGAETGWRIALAFAPPSATLAT